MTTKHYGITQDEFLSGKYDDFFTAVNAFQLESSDIIPLHTSSLSQAEMMKVVSRLPQYPFVVSKWQGVVGAHGHTVHINIDGNNAESTRKRKETIKEGTYRLLYSKSKWNSVKNTVVELLCREGSAIIRLNDEEMPIVDSRFSYNMYWNDENKRMRYAYKDKKGNEVAGLKDLYHGEEIFVIKHPSFIGWPIALSPVETILMIARLEFHATVSNQKIFDNGMVGQLFLQFSKELLPDIKAALNESLKDDKEPWFRSLMRQINDKFKGSKNSNQASFVPGLDGVLNPMKDNSQMQFFELLKELTPERIAWNWLLTPADFGTGNNTTYNNAQTFDESLYDKVGRNIEEQLDECINEWFLPIKGVRTTEKFYVKYTPPEDPSKLAQLKEAREDFKARLITRNEFREMKGLLPLDDSDAIEELSASKEPEFNYIDAVVQPKRGYRDASFTTARDYRATTVDKALATEEFTGKKGFLTKLTKAIDKQLTEYAERLEGMEEVHEKVEIKPLETFYSFPALKKDLLKFAEVALDEVQKDKRTTFAMKREFFDGEYPQSVLDFIDEAVGRILKGDKVFASVDVETASQIETIIQANISDGVAVIASKILESVENISFNRAELIAQTEVANAVEGTREIMYKSDPVFDDGGHKWLTSVNDVCLICKENEAQGIISIDKSFASGNTRPSAHPRCKCDVLYYTADEV